MTHDPNDRPARGLNLCYPCPGLPNSMCTGGSPGAFYNMVMAGVFVGQGEQGPSPGGSPRVAAVACDSPFVSTCEAGPKRGGWGLPHVSQP